MDNLQALNSDETPLQYISKFYSVLWKYNEWYQIDSECIGHVFTPI